MAKPLSSNTETPRRYSLLRKSTLVFIMLLSISPLLAQQFEGGLLAGFNGSQIRGDMRSYGFHKFGLLAGAWVQADINDYLYWSLELKYSQKGSQVNPTEKNGYYSYIYRANYIDMPIAIGYKHEDYFSLFGGLSFNYLVNRSAEVYYEAIELDPGFHNWEVAGFVGIRVNFTQLVKQNWADYFKLDFRFQYSAIPIYTTNNQLFYYSPYSQFNSVLSTALYYSIPWR